jgi:hypothetical protein
VIVDDVETVEVDTRPFTKAELRSVKRAFIVPSKEGLAVCFRRKNGGEDFMALDEKSSGRAWEEVNLKQSVVVMYKDGVQKLRILNQNSWSVLDFLRKILSNGFR